MSKTGVEACILLLANDKEFREDVKDNGGRARLLYGFNLTKNEKKKIVNGIQNGANPRHDDFLPTRRTKGTGGIRSFI